MSKFIEETLVAARQLQEDTDSATSDQDKKDLIKTFMTTHEDNLFMIIEFLKEVSASYPKASETYAGLVKSLSLLEELVEEKKDD